MKKLYTFLALLITLFATTPVANAWNFSSNTGPIKIGLYFNNNQSGEKQMTFSDGVWTYEFTSTLTYVNFTVRAYWNASDYEQYYANKGSGTVGTWTSLTNLPKDDNTSFYQSGMTSGKKYRVELTGADSNTNYFKFRFVEVTSSGSGNGGGTTPTAPQANYPGGVPKQGAVKNANGTVTFCLAAPNKSDVKIVGSWNNYTATQMSYQDYNGFRYFWVTVSGLDNSTWYPYYYYVDSKYKVADPYARLILDPVDDPGIPAGVWDNRPAYPTGVAPGTRFGCYKGDFDDYNWQVTDFHRASRSTLSIYELLVRDFTGTNNAANGEGTFRSAMAKIPYLKDLGITAVELMPVMEFDHNTNWGYDTNAHFAVDKSYGSPDDLRAFIDECHANGIAVIIDMVFNHLTDRSTWKQMYDAGQSPFFNVTAPHNWSVHNDIRQSYGLVEPYLKDVLTFWLTSFKVDGFRFDLVKGLGDDNSYGDNYDGNKSNPSTVARMKRLNAHMKSIKEDVLCINEFFGDYVDDVALGNDGQMVWNHQKHEAQHYATACQSLSGCDNSYGDLEWCSWSKISRPKWGTVDYVESHDEPWLAYMAKNSANVNISGSLQTQMDRLGAIAAQLLIAYGPKMFWEQCELGYDEQLRGDGDTPKTTEAHGNNRLERKKVHWEYLDVPERKALHDVYRAMLHLRNDNPTLFADNIAPQYEGFTQSSEAARTVRLTNGDKEVILFVNPQNYAGNGTATATATGATKINAANYKVIASSSNLTTPNVSRSGNNVSVSGMPANSFVVLASAAVVGGVGFEVPSDPYTIYFDNTDAKWATPYIHYWGGTTSSNYPGVAMTAVDGHPNLWSYTVAGGTTQVLFNAGDGDKTKTSDFVAVENGIYNQSGKTNKTLDDFASQGGNEGGNQGGNEGGNEGGEQTADGWYLVGSDLTGVDDGWADNEAYKMTEVSENVYTITVTGLTGDIKFKKGGTWDGSLGTKTTTNKLAADAEYSLDGTNDITVDGTIAKAVITLNTFTKKVYVRTKYEVAIAGAFNNWSLTENKKTFAIDATDLTATFEVEDYHNAVEGVNGEGFKMVIDGQWLSNAQDGGELTLGQPAVIAVGNNSGNMSLPAVCEGKTVVFTYNALTRELTVTEAPTVVTVTELTLSQTELELNPRDKVDLTYTSAPADAEEFEVEWASSDATIATVSNKGRVTAKKAGSCVITVSVVGKPEVKATCTVNVVNPWGDLNEDGCTNISDVQKLNNYILNN